jgi:diguanylate cyclase (GGDEF)-like protein
MMSGDEFVTCEDITDRVKTEEALRESGDKLEKLHDVARRLAACISEEEVYHVAVEAAKRIIAFSFCSLGIVEGKHLVTKVTDPHPFIDETKTMSTNEGLTGTTLRNKKTHVLREIRKGVKSLSPQSQYLSLISAPIGDLGVFQAASIDPDAFSKDDTRLLELLLGHTAAAIKRIRLQNELKEQAIHDPLTGLYNRYYLDKVLDQEVKRSKRYNHSIAFLMIDVNRFKEINDRYGHQMGDEILREVAELLRETVRETDIVVRYGGDEFLIVLVETTGEVDSVKRRIAKKVALLNKNNGRVDIPVSLSIGNASWNPRNHKSVEEIMNEADRRMYENKKNHNGHAKRGNHA